MTKPRILFISQELTPYLTEQPASVRGRLIPQGLQEKGNEVRTFMPKYGCINERRNQLHEVIRLSGMNLIIDDTDHPLIIKVATLLPTRMQVYFIDNDDYFRHSANKELEIAASPEDNDERLLFFVRGTIETVKKLRWAPQVIHCMGWISSLAPMYLKRLYNDDPALCDAKIVFSLTGRGNMAEPMPERLVEKMKLDQLTDEDFLHLAGNKAVTVSDLARIGIDYADAVVIDDPEADSELIEYAKSKGKPVLEYGDPQRPVEDVDAEVISRLLEFYKSI